MKSKNSTILVVDDEPDILIVIGKYLEAEGFRVLTAPGGQKAIELYKSEKIDLVILDIAMPVMNGLDVLRQIKQISKDAPVIMITAYRDAEKVVEAFRLGAFDCIFKPFDFKYLSMAIFSKLLE